MFRNEGKFYSVADIKELISDCKERYINLVPEIDMPGLRKTFECAMKINIQPDSGVLR